jgi:prevent-host-death family protein
MTMTDVGIAELKARLSEYLRRVRRGHPVTVLDRDTPIARIVPYDSADDGVPIRASRADGRRLQQVKLPPPLVIGGDIVDLLLLERQGNR